MNVTIARTVILYLFVILGIRLMGKRQIGDMQPNELVITLLISEIAAIPLQDPARPVLDGVIAIFVLVILEILMSVLTMKSLWFKKLMNGKSAVIIQNGVIDQKAMRDVRMTVLDLMELLRGQNVFDLSTVAFAVLEVNGDLSVLLKSSEKALTAGDVNAQKDPAELPLPVVSDGRIVKENLSALKLNEEDLRDALKNEDVSLDEVFIMTMDQNRHTKTIRKGTNP